MSPKLMFVVNVDWFFLSHRLPIALEAQRQGYQVHIATGLTDKLDELKRYGLVVHALVLDRGSTGLGDACSLLLQLWKLFRAVRPDLVHLVTIKPVLVGGLAARLAHVPAVVVAVSGLGSVFTAQGARAKLRRWMVGLMYRAALAHRNLRVIFQNPNDLQSLSKVAAIRKSCMAMIKGSGVDLRHFAPEPLRGGIPVVVLPARILLDKGVLEFVQAARMLAQRRCRARFALVGNLDPANPTSVTQARLDAWVAEGVVEWWGQRLDMPEVMASSQLVVLPSYGEGLPKVLLEAAACGRAVVTTDVPGCRDAITRDVTGLLVPVRNSMALADAIETLINDPARCRNMGEAGRALALVAFDVQQVVAAHMLIYQELRSTQ
jgi:glycosyltransferase involved in cell wall biosynthesis